VHKKKPLSLTTVNWTGPAQQEFSPEFIAEAKGFFTQQGITTVTNLINLDSPAQWVAIVLSGSANFMQGSSSVITAVQTGAPMRAVAMTEAPTIQDIGITSAFASAHRIPTRGNTEAQVLLQFKALRGTHITIATPNSTTNAYDWLVVFGHKYGLSVGINAPNDDINIFVAGGAANATAAIEAGKVDAIGEDPPFPLPNMVIMPLWKLPPANISAGNYVDTTISMIHQHPDTVQAVVTALTEAAEFVKTHPNQAFDAIQGAYSAYLLTPSEQLTLFKDYSSVAWLMYPTRNAYNAEALIVNESQAQYGAQITIPYTSFVVPRFAAAALKQLHLSY
jgi:ABC-type nitrate/sulfonate/bicarbonate transport system substrate-binding protein